MQIGACNAERSRDAFAGIEEVAGNRYVMAGHSLKQLSRSGLAQRQHAGELEAGIDGAGNAVQFPRHFKRSQQTAYALVAHDRK